MIGFSVSAVLPTSFLDLELAAERSLLHSGVKYIRYEMEWEKLHPFNIRASVCKVILTGASEIANGFVAIVNLEPQLFYAVMKHEFQLTNQEAWTAPGFVEAIWFK